MQSPPFPRYLVPPRSKYSPQHHVLKHPQLRFLPQCQRPSFTPIQNKGKIIVLYILHWDPYKSKFLIYKSLRKASAVSNAAVCSVNVVRKAENIGTDILQLFKIFYVLVVTELAFIKQNICRLKKYYLALRERNWAWFGMRLCAVSLFNCRTSLQFLFPRKSL